MIALLLAFQTVCTPAEHAPMLDHAIVAVRDLDAAVAAFRAQGFRIKPGRLHANNLLNAHIKFRDRTEVELMTVRGRAGDTMAEDYAELIRAGDGGAYVALKVGDLAHARRAAARAGLGTKQSASGAWQFVSFPATSPAAAIFFTSGDVVVQDPDSILAHASAASGLADVWIDGGAAVDALLSDLGATRCGIATGPDGVRGTEWKLARGSIVVVPSRGDTRLRVRGVTLIAPGARDVIRPVPTFWIRYRD